MLKNICVYAIRRYSFVSLLKKSNETSNTVDPRVCIRTDVQKTFEFLKFQLKFHRTLFVEYSECRLVHEIIYFIVDGLNVCDIHGPQCHMYARVFIVIDI